MGWYVDFDATLVVVFSYEGTAGVGKYEVAPPRPAPNKIGHERKYEKAVQVAVVLKKKE